MKNTIMFILFVVLLITFTAAVEKNNEMEEAKNLFAKEVNLNEVFMSGMSFFEGKIEIKYIDGKFDSVKLLSGTTTKQQVSQVFVAHYLK